MYHEPAGKNKAIILENFARVCIVAEAEIGCGFYLILDTVINQLNLWLR